jgi:hypothetical protein
VSLILSRSLDHVKSKTRILLSNSFCYQKFIDQSPRTTPLANHHEKYVRGATMAKATITGHVSSDLESVLRIGSVGLLGLELSSVMFYSKVLKGGFILISTLSHFSF